MQLKPSHVRIFDVPLRQLLINSLKTQTYRPALNMETSETVVTGQDGWGTFSCASKGLQVWVSA
jgi:hypothetical protein